MVKKLRILGMLFISLIFLLNPIRSYAYGILSTSYESANDRYRVELDMAPYDVAYLKAKITKSGQFVSEQQYTKTATTMNLYVECNGTITISWYNDGGTLLGSDSFSATQIANEGSSCAPAGGGGEDPPPDDGGGDDEGPDETDPCDGYLSHLYPQCPDYDGGGEDPPPDDGGTDPPPDDSGGGGTACPGCEMFACPGWSDYMGKVDEIIAGIPTITEAIAQQTETIRNDIVGQPPSLPSEPSDPAPVDTYDFENSAPIMKENDDLGNSGYTLTDLENNAPEIPFRDDPTGGFNIVDPVEALPDPPTKFPIPGETESEWDDNKPQDSEVVTPDPPIVELHPYMPYPPKPSEGSTEPPTPGDSGGGAPVPDSTEGPDASMKYKTHPENPDGV